MIWNAKNGSAAVGGTVMHYVSFGSGRKPLILLPGLSDGLMTVRNKALLLAYPYRMFFRDYTVYIFSRKENMPDHYTIRQMADDQAAVMKTLGLKNAAVMGVSEGGMIAQYLAADHPECVGILIPAVTAPACSELIRSNITKWMELARSGDHRALMTDTAEKSYSPGYLKKYRLIYPLIGLIGKPADYRRFLINAEAILDFDAAEILSSIRCPVLIIGGEEDRTVGAEASRQLHRLIPGSELYLYPGLGHAAYEEAPDFYHRVLKFLEKNDKGDDL